MTHPSRLQATDGKLWGPSIYNLKNSLESMIDDAVGKDIAAGVWAGTAAEITHWSQATVSHVVQSVVLPLTLAERCSYVPPSLTCSLPPSLHRIGLVLARVSRRSPPPSTATHLDPAHA